MLYIQILVNIINKGVHTYNTSLSLTKPKVSLCQPKKLKCYICSSLIWTQHYMALVEERIRRDRHDQFARF